MTDTTNTTDNGSSITPLPSSTGTTTTTAPTGNTAPVTPSAPQPEGTLSTVPGGQPGMTLSAAQMSAIQNQNVQNAVNPILPTAATATPVNQQVNQNELMTTQSINPNADQVNPADSNIQASTVQNTAQAAAAQPIQAAQVTANQVDLNALAHTTQAVTAALPSDALVSTQLQQLLTPDANGNLPSWVQPAITAAQQLLTGRGISNSTMAGQAITAAILTAAIPVATSNASAELTSYQQNLSNEQAAAMQNGQSVVQGMLTNQAADNAAANFNATSTNQTNQFMASLATQINQFNVAQTNSISQFNATQKQSAATSSAQLLSQIDQFNANMANQREQFNVQNAIIVQQSNVEYLRAVNTANTAVANQDNQLNAQNAMNMSDTAMANLQLEFNDNATMLYNSNMTAEQQSYALAYLSQQYGLQNQLDQNITSAQEGQALSQNIGTLATNLFSPLASAAGSAIATLAGFGSNNPGTTTGQSGVPPDSTVTGANGVGSSGTAPTTDLGTLNGAPINLPGGSGSTQPTEPSSGACGGGSSGACGGGSPVC